MSKVYETLPVKYRPRVLAELIGQDSVVSQLRGMFKAEKIPRTFLIAGTWGSGKTSTARLIARYVNCSEPAEDGTPCLTCPSCERMSKGTHPDVQEMNAADTRGIDTIRALNEAAKYKPQTNYRIYILDEVHQLTAPAFQALLKILEEPPSSTIFILCTTEPYRVPKAVASRATKLLIKDIDPADTAELLEKVAKAEEQELPVQVYMQIAKAVHGHPRDALSLLESALNVCRGTDDVESINFEEFIVNTVRDIVGEPIEAIAMKFLVSIYLGKYVGAIKALQSSKDYNALLNVILKYHVQATFYSISEKLHDGYYADFYAFLNKKGIESGTLQAEVLTKIMDIFMLAASDLKQYMVDGHYVLINAALRAVAVTRAQ
jgi:DNA polymerase-3 subunit gamma/tau